MVSPIARVPMWPAFAVAVAALLLCSLPASLRAEEAAADESAAAPEGPSFVLTLDSSNFSDTVAKHPFIVVEFYAPWCGHCKNLAPEYEKAAAALSKHDPPIVLAKVDANDEANKELASKYEVKGYPTIQILRNEGKDIQEYKGPREAEGIVEYLKKQAGPASVELKSSEDVSKHFNQKKVYIVGVFSKFSGEEFEKYITVAEKLRSDYDFGHTSDAKFLPRGESTVKPPFVRLLKPFDELHVDSEDFSVDSLEKFIEGSSVPLVTLFDDEPDNQPFIMKFFDNDGDKSMFFLDFSSENFEALKSAYHDVARNSKDKKISFLMGDLNAAERAFEFFGLKKEQIPLIIVQSSNGKKKFLKANVEPTQIAAWIKDYLDGNVQPFRRSEPIPEVNNEPVKVVVGESFNDVVSGSGKNVLIEFYAPWCGHCKKLAPILDEVATSLQSDANVVIAKLDATANDVPNDDFDINGFPTLYLRTPSGKLVKYEGDRTKDDIIAFIQENRDPAVEAKSVKDEL